MTVTLLETGQIIETVCIHIQVTEARVDKRLLKKS
jgi:hypothetical protein